MSFKHEHRKRVVIISVSLVLLVVLLSSISFAENTIFYDYLTPAEKNTVLRAYAEPTLEAREQFIQTNDDPLYDCKILSDGYSIDSKERISVFYSDEKGKIKEKEIKAKKLAKEITKIEAGTYKKGDKLHCGDTSDVYELASVLVFNQSDNLIYGSLKKGGSVESGYVFWTVNRKFGTNLTNTTPAYRAYEFQSDDMESFITSTGKVAFKDGNEYHWIDDSDICSQVTLEYGPQLVFDRNGDEVEQDMWYNRSSECSTRAWKEWSHNETVSDDTGDYVVEHYTYFAEISFYGNETDPTFNIASDLSNVWTSQATIEPNNITHPEVNYSGLVAYWNFEADINETTTYDWSASNLDSTSVNGDAHINTGVIGQYSLELDGTGDYVSFGSPTTLEFDYDDPFSMCFWLYGRDYSATEIVLSKRDTTTPYAGWELYVTSGNKPTVAMDDGDEDGLIQPTTGTINEDEWAHICWSYNGNGKNFYENTMTINGVDQTLIGSTSAIFETSWNIDTPFQLGRRYYTAANELDGFLDEVMVFDYEITLAEMQDIYNNQSSLYHSQGNASMRGFDITVSSNNTANVTFEGSYAAADATVTANIGGWWNDSRYDSHPNLLGHWSGDGTTTDELGFNDGSINGGATYTDGKIGDTFSFDGTGDYITVADDSRLDIGTGDWSFSAWVYVDSVASYDGIVTSGAWNSNVDNFNFITHVGGTRYWLLASTGSGWWINLQSSSNSLIKDQWQHIVVTLDRDGAQKIYIDGFEDASQSTTNTNDFDTGSDWNFGEQITYGDLDGEVDDVMMWNKTLSLNEIKTLYNKGLMKLDYNGSAKEIVDGVATEISYNNQSEHIVLMTEMNTGAENFSSAWVDITSAEVVTYEVSGAPPGDSCTYSSGDYVVSCSDNCDEGNIDLGGNDFILTGTGTYKGNLTNYNDITITSSVSCDAWIGY